MMTVDEFRSAFPVFDALAFPDSAVEYRLKIADAWFTANPWIDETIRDHAKGLYVAHSLAMLGSVAVGGSGTGSMASGSSGVISSKSVDGASVSFDTGAVTSADAGFWNATPYGRELWDLFMLFGAGARQLW